LQAFDEPANEGHFHANLARCETRSEVIGFWVPESSVMVQQVGVITAYGRHSFPFELVLLLVGPQILAVIHLVPLPVFGRDIMTIAEKEDMHTNGV
jgi:hypothetical protein